MKRKQAARAVIPLILVLFLSACASTQGISLAEKQAAITGYRLPSGPNPGEAIVYIVRPDSLGVAVRFKVYLDGKREEGTYVGYTRGQQYLAFPVSAGSHVIHSKAENWSSLDISAKAGDIIFLKQTPQMGFLFASNYLEQIDVIDGKYLMAAYDLERGTYIEQDLVPYGPPEELAEAKIPTDNEPAQPETSAKAVVLEADQLIGSWEGSISFAGSQAEVAKLVINSKSGVSYTGQISGRICPSADFTLTYVSGADYSFEFTDFCDGNGDLRLVGNNLRGEVRIEQLGASVEFNLTRSDDPVSTLDSAATEQAITPTPAANSNGDANVEVISVEKKVASTQIDPSAPEHSFLGLWRGEMFLQSQWPYHIEFLIDRNDSNSASGSVTAVTDMTVSSSIDCYGAIVTLKSQGKDKALITFESPTCQGSRVVSLTDDMELKGKAQIEGRYWTIDFKKSS